MSTHYDLQIKIKKMKKTELKLYEQPESNTIQKTIDLQPKHKTVVRQLQLSYNCLATVLFLGCIPVMLFHDSITELNTGIDLSSAFLLSHIDCILYCFFQRGMFLFTKTN